MTRTVDKLPSHSGNQGEGMNTYAVTMGRGGSGTFVVVVYALTPDMARNIAMRQYPGCSAQAVKVARGSGSV